MSSLFKPVRTIYLDEQGKRVKKGTPGARKTRQRSTKWWGQYAVRGGRWHRVPLYTDKTASGQMLAELVRKAELGKANCADPFEEHAKRPLLEHLDDFERSLLAGGSTGKHITLKIGRIRRVVEGAGFKVIGDLSASRVQDFLAELRKAGVPVKQRNGTYRQQSTGTATLNYYLREIKAFARWLVRDRRTFDNVLTHLEGGNAALDKRHHRRGLDLDEVRTVVNKTALSTRVFRGLSGRDRSILYAVAFGTGFRVAELASLTTASFDLEGRVVYLDADKAKNRKETVQPISAELVETLRDWLKGKRLDGTCWPGSWTERAARMFRADLEDAGITYLTEDGFADFHALRHSYISRLAQSGIAPKLAQELARHSDTRLTMNRYAHVGLYDLATAVDSLPTLAGDKSAALAATGTDDRQVLRAHGRAQETEISCQGLTTVDGTMTGEGPAHLDPEPLKNAINDGICERMTTHDSTSGGGDRTRDTRLMKPLL
jgi:integrase/recombinase XerC